MTRICFNDYDREIALVAESKPLKDGEEKRILGVGRLSKLVGANEAEFAVLVSNHSQNQGPGFELLKCLIEIGCAEKLNHLGGQILAENHAMQHICKMPRTMGARMARPHDKLADVPPALLIVYHATPGATEIITAPASAW